MGTGAPEVKWFSLTAVNDIAWGGEDDDVEEEEVPASFPVDPLVLTR
jgi:hypothetical protein